MGQIIIMLIALVLVTSGVICIFDARLITKKMFSFGDQNEGSMGLKMIGFILATIGAFVFYFVVK